MWVAMSASLPARNLVLAFFHAASDRSLDVATLVTATGILGLTSNSTRVTLSRLLSEGWVTRDERGRYRLRGDRARAASGLSPYARISSAVRQWTSKWLGCVVDEGDASLADRLQRLGFRAAAPNLFVRPDNLRGGAELIEARLGAARLFAISPTGIADATAQWKKLWDCEALSNGYAEMRERMRKSRASQRRLSPEKALAENFDAVQTCIATLERDPLLPAEWVDARARFALVTELTAYDRECRTLWMKTIPGLQLAAFVETDSPWNMKEIA